MTEEAPRIDTQRCSRCGLASPLRELFVSGRDGTLDRVWCPRCMERRRRNWDRFRVVTGVLLVGLGAFNMANSPAANAHALTFGYGIFMLTLVLMAMPHEIAHAAVARLVGFIPIAITVGSGKPFFEGELFGVRVQVADIASGSGHTYVAIHDAPTFRWRMIAVLAAGPLLHIVAAGGALGAYRALAGDSSEQVRIALLAFAIGNGYTALRNLWPHRSRDAAGATMSDGEQILERFRNEPLDFGLHRAAISYLRASFAYADRDYGRAQCLAVEAELESTDAQFTAMISVLRAEALSEAGDASGAIALLQPMLERADLHEGERMHVAQAYAWAEFVLDEPAALIDALRRIEHCVQLLPWGEVVRIKHACIAAARWTHDQGRPGTLRRLEECLPRPREIGRESLAYRSLARGLIAAADGDVARAHREYANAKSQHVSEPSLRVLERRLASR
jgi:hypothetical protein